MTVAGRLTVLGTGAAVAVSIVGASCSTNARIKDIQAAIIGELPPGHAGGTRRYSDGKIRRVDERERAMEIDFGGQSDDTPPAGVLRQR